MHLEFGRCVYEELVALDPRKTAALCFVTSRFMDAMHPRSPPRHSEYDSAKAAGITQEQIDEFKAAAKAAEATGDGAATTSDAAPGAESSADLALGVLVVASSTDHDGGIHHLRRRTSRCLV